jgi:hypothetical protein
VCMCVHVCMCVCVCTVRGLCAHTYVHQVGFLRGLADMAMAELESRRRMSLADTLSHLPRSLLSSKALQRLSHELRTPLHCIAGCVRWLGCGCGCGCTHDGPELTSFPEGTCRLPRCLLATPTTAPTLAWF